MMPSSLRSLVLLCLASCGLGFAQVKPSSPAPVAPARPAVPVAAAAPQASPALSDKVLRERAAQFLQYTVGRAYSKAYALVSDDTKDWYLSSGKPQYAKFRIDGVDYSKDRKAATVRSTVTRVLSMNGREVSTELAVTDEWRVSGGKWMWWHDPNILVTPFGEVKVDRSSGVQVTDEKSLPRDMSQEAAEKAEKNLNLKAEVDKSELVFDRAQAGDQELVFHNGLKGVVRVTVDVVGDYRAFSVDPKEMQVLSDGELKLHVHYKPMPDLFQASLRITIDPFNRAITVPLQARSATSAQ